MATTTLTELFRGLLEHAVTQGACSFPSLTAQAWHELLYALADSGLVSRDLIGTFDWDGAFPQSPRFRDEIAPGLAFVTAPARGIGRIVLTAERPSGPERGSAPVPEDLVRELYRIAGNIPDFIQYT